MKQHPAIRRWITISIVSVLLMPIAAGCADPRVGPSLEHGETGKVAERSDIETKYTWATEDIFPNVAEWEKEFAAVEKKVEELAGFKNTLNKGPDQLYKILQARDDDPSFWAELEK